MMIGSYTREIASREIRPVGQFTPDFSHSGSLGRNGASHRTAQGIGSCAKISCLLVEAQLQLYARFDDGQTVLFHLRLGNSVTRQLVFMMNRFAFIPIKCEWGVIYDDVRQECNLKSEFLGLGFDKEAFQCLIYTRSHKRI